MGFDYEAAAVKLIIILEGLKSEEVFISNEEFVSEAREKAPLSNLFNQWFKEIGDELNTNSDKFMMVVVEGMTSMAADESLK